MLETGILDSHETSGMSLLTVGHAKGDRTASWPLSSCKTIMLSTPQFSHLSNSYPGTPSKSSESDIDCLCRNSSWRTESVQGMRDDVGLEGYRTTVLTDLFRELAGGRGLALMTLCFLAAHPCPRGRNATLLWKALLTSKDRTVVSMNLNLGQIGIYNLKVKMI